MRTETIIFIAVFLVFIFLKTISYSVFIWKQKNIAGAIIIGILAFSVIVAPLVTLIIRG